MMNDILEDPEAHVVVYIDDIIIFTKLKISEEHNQLVKEVLDRLTKHDLFLKPKKCFFKKKEIKFLRVWVSKKGIRMDSKKVQAVQEWPHPTRVKQVQRFLGLANYYRRFIQGYSKIAHPLHELTKKDPAFKWEVKHQTAFDTLKRAFTQVLLVAFPDLNKQL